MQIEYQRVEQRRERERERKREEKIEKKRCSGIKEWSRRKMKRWSGMSRQEPKRLDL